MYRRIVVEFSCPIYVAFSLFDQAIEFSSLNIGWAEPY